ncbi:MAG: hypothetical protein QXU01_02580 [Candidatus Hadarchaeales archaeon]
MAGERSKTPPDEVNILEFCGDLVFALEHDPNIEHAIAFASKHLDSDSRLWIEKHLAEDVFTERSLSLNFIGKLRRKELVSVFQLLERAANKRGLDERKILLDRALENLLSSIRKEINSFYEKVKLPNLIIFGIGILVPLALVLLFPTFSFLGGRFTLLQAGIVYCVVLPAFVFFITNKIDQERPRCIAPPPVPLKFNPTYVSIPIFSCILVVISIFQLGDSAWLPAIWILVFSTSLLLLIVGIGPFKLRIKVEQVEEEFPDFLLEMGMSIEEGKPLEKAIADYEKKNKTPLTSVLRKIERNIQFEGTGIIDTIMSEDFKREIPSRTVHSGMILLVSAAEKGRRSAAGTIIRISNHLRKILELKKEIKDKMSDILTTARALAIFFAPILTAFTARTYEVITSKQNGFFQASFSKISLATVLCVYTLILSVLLVDYSVRLEYGKDAPLRCVNIAIAMLTALIVFTAGWIAGGLFFGFLLGY